MVKSHYVKVFTTKGNFKRSLLQALRQRSYSKVLNDFLKRYANDEAFVKQDTVIFRSTHSADMTSLQYGIELLDKAIFVGFDEKWDTINDRFTEGIGVSFPYNRCHNWSKNKNTLPVST